MSKGKRAPLGLAQTLGGHLVKMLEPSTKKVMIVGSVRRMKQMVGDVEIVALAQETTLSDLFGHQITVERTSIDEALDHLADQDYQGWRVDPRLNGRLHKRLRHIHTGLTADLYLTLDSRGWGPLVAVRTGPRDFSKLVVTTARGLGWHFADGFLLHGHLKGRRPCSDGPACTRIIPLYQEADVFQTLSLTMLSPEERERQYGGGL